MWWVPWWHQEDTREECSCDSCPGWGLNTAGYSMCPLHCHSLLPHSLPCFVYCQPHPLGLQAGCWQLSATRAIRGDQKARGQRRQVMNFPILSWWCVFITSLQNDSDYLAHSISSRLWCWWHYLLLVAHSGIRVKMTSCYQ